jgi:hypothetical protein
MKKGVADGRLPCGYCASADLLQFCKLTLFMGEFLAHLGNFFFLLADLFEDNLDRSFLDPGHVARGFWNGCWFL